jgi:hypothetical protein
MQIKSEFGGFYPAWTVLVVDGLLGAQNLDHFVGRALIADFDLHLHCFSKVRLDDPLGLELAPTLMLLHQGVETLPAAQRVHAAGGEVIDDIEGDQIFLQPPLTDRALAERAHLIYCSPVLDADVAEGVA